MAVQTFSIVPEAYQQVFIKNGADFPDELVSAIKQDPKQAAQILENDKQLKSAVVQVFKSNKESILQAAQQAQNPSSMKIGGKILGVMKFQLGGKYSVKNGDYSASVSAPGDTLRTKVYPYTTREMQTYPNGNVRYTIFRRTDTQNYWSPQSKPNFLQRLWYGNRTVPVEEAQNWEDIIANHPEDPRNIRKQQYGGIVKAQGGKKVFNLINQDRGSNGIYQRHQYGDPEGDPNNNWTYERVITPQQDTLIRRSNPTGFTFTMTSSDPTHEIVTDTRTGELQAIQDYRTRHKWNKENSFHDLAGYPKASNDWNNPYSINQ